MPGEGIRDPWTWLRRLIARPLSLGEPRTLCFDPSLSFDDRSGRNVGDISRNLILLTIRRRWLETRVRHLEFEGQKTIAGGGCMRCCECYGGNIEKVRLRHRPQGREG